MKTPVNRWIYTPDKHFPLQDKAAWTCVLKAINIIRPDGYCDLGDVGEWDSVSHWKWKRRKRPPLEYILSDIDKEIQEVDRYFIEGCEALDKANVKEKVLIQGNHDAWFDRLIEEFPYIEKDYAFDKVLHLKNRGWRYYRHDENFKNGKLFAYHGHRYGGMHHSKNHLQKMGVNLIYGHWHDIQQYSISHVDGEKSAWSIGCLKSLDPKHNDFLLGRPNNWGHAFAVVDFYDKGFFTVHVVRIVNGKCSLWGEVIDGNKKKVVTSGSKKRG